MFADRDNGLRWDDFELAAEHSDEIDPATGLHVVGVILSWKATRGEHSYGDWLFVPMPDDHDLLLANELNETLDMLMEQSQQILTQLTRNDERPPQT